MHVSRLLSRALSWLREAMLTDTPPRWAGEDNDHRLTVVTVAEPGAIRAHVTGEVDRDNAGHLREALLSAVRRGGHRLIIDLVGVPLLDAAGVGVLLAVYEAARVRNVQVRVVGLQPYVARIVAVSGLGTLLDD
jgi:RNA polymerase sigma-B factor